jgi:hypothetical protein
MTIDCKLDSMGNIEWQKCLGGSALDMAYLYSTNNCGDFIIAGYSLLTMAMFPVNMMGLTIDRKIDSSGNLQWQKWGETVLTRLTYSTNL